MLQCLPWTTQKHTGLQKQTQKTLKTRKVNPTLSENEKHAEKHAKKKKKKKMSLELCNRLSKIKNSNAHHFFKHQRCQVYRFSLSFFDFVKKEMLSIFFKILASF